MAIAEDTNRDKSAKSTGPAILAAFSRLVCLPIATSLAALRQKAAELTGCAASVGLRMLNKSSALGAQPHPVTFALCFQRMRRCKMRMAELLGS